MVKPGLKLTVPENDSPSIVRINPGDSAAECLPSPAVQRMPGCVENNCVTPTAAAAEGHTSWGRSYTPKSGSTSSSQTNGIGLPYGQLTTGPLSPQPVMIDFPSPGSFDPLLEHFLRPLEELAPMTMCLMQRTGGGKGFRMLLEAGNVPLLVGEKRSGREFIIAAVRCQPTTCSTLARLPTRPHVDGRGHERC